MTKKSRNPKGKVTPEPETKKQRGLRLEAVFRQSNSGPKAEKKRSKRRASKSTKNDNHDRTKLLKKSKSEQKFKTNSSQQNFNRNPTQFSCDNISFNQAFQHGSIPRRHLLLRFAALRIFFAQQFLVGKFDANHGVDHGR